MTGIGQGYPGGIADLPLVTTALLHPLVIGESRSKSDLPA